ncbi:hypothetical protein AX14_009173 [Amanita brunnescens Koide BX004]|nr:hypothetical protein AX14_009173 [Amanita brunnescens Koide BX004]
MSAGFFKGAHNFVVTSGQFTEINHYSVSASLDTPLTPLPPLKQPSAFFTGHDEYLQRLKAHFRSEVRVGDQRKSFLLHGLGGIGKTQICLKFIKDNIDLFSDIFWIDASSESSIELELIHIVQANNISKESKLSAESALQWISHRANWLIVYDSADGHYSVLEKFLPPGNGGNVLITSRNPALKRITLNQNSVEVLEMTDEDGISLLLKSAMLNETSDHIIGVARKLVSELGGIPLAIDQAGGYMLSSGCSKDDYLELYTKHRDKLLSSLEFKGASGYDRNTYGTWDIAMQKIENMASRDTAALNAIKLFSTFAFLDHANIPEELFKSAAENYMKRNLDKETNTGLPLSVELLHHEALFLNEEGEWDKFEFVSGIQILLSFSLIKSHNQLYSMHSLVHAWSRSRLPKSEITDLYQRARALLSCSVLLDYDIDNYTFCKLLAPHIRSSSLHAAELNLKSRYYDDEYARFSHVFTCVGDWHEREKLLVEQVNERKSKLGYNHSDTLFSMNCLGSTYNRQGRWNEAERLQVEVLNDTKAKLGSDHPDALTSMNTLALTYQSQGRWNEAEKLQVEVMNERKAKLGLNHPDTLTSMSTLAVTYRSQGRWNEAEKLQVEVMNERKAKFGPDHPDTLTCMNNLAVIYQSQGRWNEAEKLQVEVIKARKAKLGSNHPDTLTSMNTLAVTYWSQGRWDKAEKLQVEVMNERKAKFGSDHPDTLTCMNNLALTYQRQGRCNEAEKLQVEVMNERKAKFGSDHPDTLTCISNLALIYQSQWRWNEAEKLQVEVLNTRKAKLGSNHPDTLTSMNTLALTYLSQRRWNEAEKLHVEVMNQRKSKFGSDHPDTLTSMNNSALTYQSQGRWNEAEKLHVEVLGEITAKFGSEHPDTLTCMNNLALTYHSQERWNEAEKLQVKVLNGRKANLGSNHPDALKAMANLALTYRSQRRWEEADFLLSHAVDMMQEVIGPQHPTTLKFLDELDKLSKAKPQMDAQQLVTLPSSNHSLDHFKTTQYQNKFGEMIWQKAQSNVGKAKMLNPRPSM